MAAGKFAVDPLDAQAATPNTPISTTTEAQERRPLSWMICIYASPM
jgi:hypothetical protein